MLTLTIHQLKLSLYLGVHAWEQETLRDIPVNLTLEVDAAQAGHSDDLADTLDYANLCHKLGQALNGQRIALVEALVRRIMDILLQEPRIQRASVEVIKVGAVDVAESIACTLTEART